MRCFIVPALCLLLAGGLLLADGPQDNIAEKVRPVPPTGIKLVEADRTELADGVLALGQEIDALRAALKGKPALLELLPDVQIYYNAVHYAFKYDEFFQKNQVAGARQLLKQGHERAAQLRDGQAPGRPPPG